MSRLGKQLIQIPEGVTVTKNGSSVVVSGPKGNLSKDFRGEIEIVINEEGITLSKKVDTVLSRALWGTYASHLSNMIKGVVTPFEKKLILDGVGFKSEVQGNTLKLALGFSHPVLVSIPEGLTVTAEKNTITIFGIDKELVGRFSAETRSLKKPEPYKGKGFHYSDEVIRRKQGKKSA
jgi:large subunit ribosomal protein L6